MKKIVIILLMLPICVKTQSQSFLSIPSDTLSTKEILNGGFDEDKIFIESFEISKFITWQEYKEFLKDNDYNLNLYPDTNAISKEKISVFISSEKFDNYPVVAISWDNAIKFCKWKTLKENNDTIKVYYTLPLLYEWLAAHYYLERNTIKHDFNQNYSDWLLRSYDESNWRYLTYAYNHKKDDPKSLKRKHIFGNNFLYQRQQFDIGNYFYGYADEGLNFVAFRIVKRFQNPPLTIDNILNFPNFQKLGLISVLNLKEE
jgi:hypothetical protein